MKKLFLSLLVLLLSSCGEEVSKEKDFYKCVSWFLVYKETSIHENLTAANVACRIRRSNY